MPTALSAVGIFRFVQASKVVGKCVNRVVLGCPSRVWDKQKALDVLCQWRITEHFH
jgi:hypothetical protein